MSAANNTLEKIGLMILAGASVLTLAVIAIMAIRAGSLDPNAATMIGVIITGLIAFSKDIVQALRGYAMNAQVSKLTDQLAASGPAADPTVPQQVEVTNTSSDPVITKPVNKEGET